MQWIAQTGDGDGNPREFDRLLFTLTNPADEGKALTIGAVPLPAAAWLLMVASGGPIAAKCRSARRA